MLGSRSTSRGNGSRAIILSSTRGTLLTVALVVLSTFALPEVSGPEPTEAGSWAIETVDSIGDVGQWTSIALDIHNHPHISYYDLVNDNLKYARWNGTDWNIETVDSYGNVGECTSLALDSNDRPHISYWDNDNQDLKYAKWNGTDWNIETVDSAGRVGEASSIALDSQDYPRISYIDWINRHLKYAKWNGTYWNIEIVDSSGLVGFPTSIEVDSNDYPHVAYEVANDELNYARWNGSTWNLERVDVADGFGSLDLDSNDYPQISYFDHNNHDLKYARWNGSAWNIETVDILGYVGSFSSLAIDSNDHPHIGYFDYTNDALKYARWNGSAWNLETVDSDGYVGSYTSMALDSNDIPHISYYDSTNGVLKYATKVRIGPRPPKMLQASLSGRNLENVTFSWSLSPDDGMGSNTVIGYEIYKDMTYDPNALGYGLVASLANGTSSFVDISVGEGDPNDYFYQVCAIDEDSNTSCAINQAGKFTRPLAKGPNLLSIPLVQLNESVEKVLQTVVFDKAWSYHAWDATDPWKWHMAFKSYKGDLETINHKVGVWVNVTEESNLTVAGIVPLTTSIQLHPGWNLVGFPSFCTDYTVGEFKLETGVVRVEGFDSSAPPYFLKLMENGDFFQVGYGYWVYSTLTVVWTTDNL